MLEKEIERKLVKGVKKLGGLCYKFESPESSGVPDRIVILNGRVIFVEVKAESGRLSSMQHYRLTQLQSCKANVRVLYGAEQVKAFLAELAGGLQ